MLKKVGLQKKKHKKITLTIDEWRQFASLLNSGNALVQCLDMMPMDTQYIKTRLEAGSRFEQLILENNKGRFYEHLGFFIEVTTLPDAIISTIEMMKWENELFKKFRKQSMYPSFIFVFSFISIYLFSQFIIPQLISSFQTDVEDQTLFTIVNLLKNGCFLLFSILLIILFVLVIQHYNTTLHRYLYNKLSYQFGFCRQSISYYLSGYFIQLQKKGMSSKQSLQYMMRLQKKSYLSYTVEQLYAHLQEGEELLLFLENNRYLDRQFKNYFMIGSHNSDLVSALQSYMNIQMIRWEKQLKFLTNIIQSFAYIFVGILVVCVYQIMLIPLQMLEQF